MMNTNSDYLTRVKLAVNDIAKATSEPGIYKNLAEALVKYFGFSHVTIRKVDWEKGVLSLMCYLGFVEEVPALDLPLSEEAVIFRRAAFKGESLAVFEGEEMSLVLRLPIKFENKENVTLSPSFAIIPIKVGGRVRIVLGVNRKTSGIGITSEDKEILDLFSEMVGTTLEKVFAKEELETELVRDELTGLLNKDYFVKRLDEEFERAKRYDIPLSCCIFEIDDFKLINETYGRSFGDQVLKQIAGLIKTVVGHSDIVARYGDEEFAVLSFHTALEDTLVAVEQIRRFISALVFPYHGKGVRVTATFGISEYQSGNAEKPEDLLYNADMALYEGKKRYDKNCLVVCAKNGFKLVEKAVGQHARRAVGSDSIIQTEEASKKEAIAELKTLGEKVVERKETKHTAPFGAIIQAPAKNLKDTHQSEKGFADGLRMGIRKLKKISISPQLPVRVRSWEMPLLHLGKSQSLIALVSLGIILPIIILIYFVHNKEKKPIFLSSISSSSIDIDPRLNLGFEIQLAFNRISEDALKGVVPFGEGAETTKETERERPGIPVRVAKRLSPKHRIQKADEWEIAEEILEENKDNSQTTPAVSSQATIKEKELKKALRIAFLLYEPDFK